MFYFTDQTRAENLFRSFLWNCVTLYFTLCTEAPSSGNRGTLLERCFFAQWGASGKWRHIPGLLCDCAEQSSHLMFPITAYVTVSPAAYLTAQNRHFALSPPPHPPGRCHPLALCTQTERSKCVFRKCARFSFRAQESLYITSKLLLHFSSFNSDQESEAEEAISGEI